MNRRCFLQSAALAFWPPVIQDPPKPVITEYEDGYVIQAGVLRCSTSGSTLVFGVFSTTHPRPGVIEETRMIPTDFLKSSLERVGFPVVWELWHPDFPFLTASLDHFPCPHDIAARLQQVLYGNDSRLFFIDPTSQARAGQYRSW